MNKRIRSITTMAAIALVSLATGLLAQDAPVVAPAPVTAVSSTVTGALGQFLGWVDANATVSSGIGITLAGGSDGFGPLLKQSVTITRKDFANSSIGLGVDHATLFANDEGYNHEQVGLSLNWKLINTPQLQVAKDGTPIVRHLPLNLSELQISPYVGCDIDRAVHGRFYGRATVIGITLGWRL